MRTPILVGSLVAILIASVTMIVALNGPTQRQRADKFMAACGHAGFSASQCSFLLEAFHEKASGTIDLTISAIH